MSRFLRWALVLPLLAGVGVIAADTARPPNILFIMTDQQRWDCVGANGNALIKTPHLDRLAARSANFSHAYVQSPVCVPSRVSFFTGRYAHAHKNRVNYTPLDRSETLLQARLKAAGYRTAVVGKLHYFPPTAEEAMRTGFDVAEVHDGNVATDRWSAYVKWRQEHDPRKTQNYRALAKDIAPGKNPFRAAIATEFSETAWVGLRTRHHLEELARTGQPFFLHASFWKPHSPFDVCTPYDTLYDDVNIPLPVQVSAEDVRRLLPEPLQKLALRSGKIEGAANREQLQWIYRSYYGAISHVDHEIGEILATLERTGQAANTLIVFSTDHGDQLLEHGIMGKNCFFESSVRVPLLVSLPGRVKAARYAELIEAVDVLPTLLELIGVPEPREVQGRSFAPLITPSGRTYAPRDAVFSENIIPEVITGGRLNLSFEKGRGVDGVRHPDAKMVRTARWKFIYYPEGYSELYDVVADPGERVNLAGRPESRATESEMKDRILHWLTTASETDQIAPRWLVYEPKP